MKLKKFILILVLVVSAGYGLAQNSTSSSIYPSIKSDNQEMTEDRLIASGNVEIAWEEYRIYADYMEFNPKTKEIIAQGRVTMVSKQTVISGERLLFNLKDRTGLLYDVYGQASPTVRYKTNKLMQVDNDTLAFDKIDFTSCSQCQPRWKITCTKGKIKKEKYIAMSNAVLKIKKIPIFYIPYLRYPLNDSGKATGFLFPGIGRSDLRGFFLFNSFFWNIKDNVDLTLGVDYYGKAGIGLNEEFRYLFPNVEGNIKFYYFHYKPGVVLGEGEAIPSDNSFYSQNSSDYFLKMTHKQRINFLDTRIIVDIDKQSDANFLRLFSNDFDAVLRRMSKSSVSVNSSLAQNIKLAANAAIHDTYFTFNNSSRSLRYLPTVSLNWNQQKIWKIPGYFSLDTSYSSVQRIGKSYDEDQELYETDISTQRLNINPSYSLSLISEPWLGARLNIQSRSSIYFKSKDLDTGEIVSEPLHLHYDSAEVGLKGPVFSKIFEFKNSKIKHIFEPNITMRYVTQVKDEDRARLVPVDNYDYPSYSSVTFSITNRLLVKGNLDKSAREILSHTISQEYYFDPEAAHRSRKINNSYPEFSELKNTLRFKPFKFFSVDAQVVYNYYLEAEKLIDNFTRIFVNVSYTNKNSVLFGAVNYSRYINPYIATGYVFNRDVIGGRVNFNLKGFPIKLDSIINYDITAKEFRQGTIKLTYDYQCIKFIGELRIFRYLGRIETQFNAGITFGNLGIVKDFLGVQD